MRDWGFGVRGFRFWVDFEIRLLGLRVEPGCRIIGFDLGVMFSRSVLGDLIWCLEFQCSAFGVLGYGWGGVGRVGQFPISGLGRASRCLGFRGSRSCLFGTRVCVRGLGVSSFGLLFWGFGVRVLCGSGFRHVGFGGRGYG